MPAHHEPALARRALDHLKAATEGSAAPGDLQESVVTLRRTLAGLAEENARLEQEVTRLRRNEAQFRELFDATYDGIFLIDLEEGRILEANDAACRLLGYALDELRDLTISDLHPYELPRFLEFAETVTRHGRWQSHELTCRAKWGELIPAELSATALVYDGRACILVLAHDLREHRLAKLGLAVSKLGHDLRNILATTQLLSDHLMASADPDVRRITPRLIDSIDRAIQLCTETLQHGRTGPPAPRPRQMALRPLLEDVCASAGIVGEARRGWHNEVPEEFALEADPDQLFRALLNLVRNAHEAIDSRPGGEVGVSAARRGGVVHIEVADTGPGLPAAARERLFQPFASAGRGQGTGLGLLIAREIAEAHGGDLRLVRSDARGTIFRFELPDSPPRGGVAGGA